MQNTESIESKEKVEDRIQTLEFQATDSTFGGSSDKSSVVYENQKVFDRHTRKNQVPPMEQEYE